MPRPLLHLAVAVLLGSAAACARSAEESEPGEAVPLEPATVVFVNQSLYQADVFAVRSSGERVRMGTVQPGRTESFQVPGIAVVAGTVNIVARLLARDALLQTGRITMGSGDTLTVTLPIAANMLSVLPGR